MILANVLTLTLWYLTPFAHLDLSHFIHPPTLPQAIFSRALSQIAEIYSFTALGLSVYRFQTHDFSLRYLCISILAMALARAVVVFGLFGLAMYFDREHRFKDAWKDQLILFGAGLVRGAITWAQVSFLCLDEMGRLWRFCLAALSACFAAIHCSEARLLVFFFKILYFSLTQTSPPTHPPTHPIHRPCNFQEATAAS